MAGCPGRNQHRPDKYRPDYKPIGYIFFIGRSDQHQSFLRHIVWHFANGIGRWKPDAELHQPDNDDHNPEPEWNGEHHHDYTVAEFRDEHHVNSVRPGHFAQQRFPGYNRSGGPEFHGIYD